MRSLRRHHAARVAAARRKYARPGQSDNELATRHPLDCGRTRCGVCHPSKRWHAKSRRAEAVL